MLEAVEIKDFFAELSFQEDSHSYYLGNEKIKYSVSDLYHKFQIPFDVEKMSRIVAAKRGISPQMVKEEWRKMGDEACLKGTSTHLFGEKYAFDRTLNPQTKQELAIVKYYKTLEPNYEPFIMELQMYHKKYKFAGTVDVVLYNKESDKLILCDYKTNINIHKNYKGQTLLGEFKHLLDSPFNLYQLQLSYYQLLIEQTGAEVEDRYIIWLKDNGNFELLQTKDYTEILARDLEKTL